MPRNHGAIPPVLAPDWPVQAAGDPKGPGRTLAAHPVVVILLATFNGAQFLTAQLDSSVSPSIRSCTKRLRHLPTVCS